MKCDLCGQSVEECDAVHLNGRKFYADAKTRRGPWAYMCSQCWVLQGKPLGVGKGQLYDVETGEKIAG